MGMICANTYVQLPLHHSCEVASMYRVTEWERSGGIEPVDEYFCATGRLTAGIENRDEISAEPKKKEDQGKRSNAGRVEQFC